MALTFKSLKDYEAWKAQARARYGTPEPEPEASEPEELESRVNAKIQATAAALREMGEAIASPPVPAPPPRVIVPKRRLSPVTAKRQAPPDSQFLPLWLESLILFVVTLLSSLFWQR